MAFDEQAAFELVLWPAIACSFSSRFIRLMVGYPNARDKKSPAKSEAEDGTSQSRSHRLADPVSDVIHAETHFSLS